jgi:2-aminobenzoylacetyl-CoA thioesterase
MISKRRLMMRIRQAGRVRDGLWFLGREESGVYLLEGNDESLIISGGMSYLVPDVLRQLEEFRIDEGRIKKLLILHSHFDHVGIVPFFKRRHPEMEIYASRRAWEILQMEKAIKTVNEFSRNVTKRMGLEAVYSAYDLEWRKDVTGASVGEGDRIDLGGVTVTILEIPGHSSCCIAGYVPEFKALFPSDGGGIPFADAFVPSGNSNYTSYQKNLDRLKVLDVDYLCADHYGYITGEEANEFIPKMIEAAAELRRRMEEAYRATGDVNAAAQELLAMHNEENPGYFLSPDILLDVFRQTLRHIAGAMRSA